MKPIYPNIQITIPKNSNPINIVSHAKAMMRAANKASLFSFDRNKKTVLLKVLVKKGTKIRYASNSVRTNNKNVVLVETLTPVKVGQMD